LGSFGFAPLAGLLGIVGASLASGLAVSVLDRLENIRTSLGPDHTSGTTGSDVPMRWYPPDELKTE
jgi:hypothetical protein